MSDALLASYSHRSKPYAPDAAFRVYADRIAIEHRGKWNDFLYRDLVMIRLMYKPKNTTSEGYQATIYRRDKRTAFLTNLSWKSLVDMERLDGDYRRFVEQLITSAQAANPAIILQAGMPGWLYGVTVIVSVLALLAIAAIMGQAVAKGSLPMAGLTAALGIYFSWWSWRYLTRNRPRRFRADAIPQDVLPKAPVTAA